MIYLDNSATTYPKPNNVISAVNRSINRYSFNSGRGGYKESIDTAQMIYNTREIIARLFNSTAENVIFINNCTMSLNIAIKGVVNEKDHVIISNLEHNSVARPIYSLAEEGKITYDIAEYSFDKNETINNFKRLIKRNTKAIVCTQASNVFGCVLPIREIGKMCKDNNIVFIVDSAQSAGIIDIDVKRDNIDILCCPGHKGLYGPMGTGIIVLNNNLKLMN